MSLIPSTIFPFIYLHVGPVAARRRVCCPEVALAWEAVASSFDDDEVESEPQEESTPTELGATVVD